MARVFAAFENEAQDCEKKVLLLILFMTILMEVHTLYTMPHQYTRKPELSTFIESVLSSWS